MESFGDSVNELEGGEVGSGHSMMALFEIRPRFCERVTAYLAKVNWRKSMCGMRLPKIRYIDTTSL